MNLSETQTRFSRVNRSASICHVDRDPKKLNIEGIEAEVRRVAFWEAKSIDQWQVCHS